MEDKRTDKIETLLDMIEHPERYSEEEAVRLLADDEARAAYDMAVRAAQAYEYRRAEADVTDEMVDGEWRKFAARQHPRRTVRFRSKAAAVTIGVIMVSGLAFAAIHTGFFGTGRQQPETVTTAADGGGSAATARTAVERGDTTATAPRQFENERLEDILAEIAACYGLKVEIRSAEARDLRLYLRWNPQEGAEKVIGSIDAFSKVRVEIKDGVITAE